VREFRITPGMALVVGNTWRHAELTRSVEGGEPQGVTFAAYVKKGDRSW